MIKSQLIKLAIGEIYLFKVQKQLILEVFYGPNSKYPVGAW